MHTIYKIIDIYLLLKGNENDENVVANLDGLEIEEKKTENEEPQNPDIVEMPIGEIWATGYGEYEDYRSSLIWAIRRKNNWQKKILDDKILIKWQKETE